MLSYIKNNKNWYLLELPLIKRQFDSIYINYKNSSSVFWDFFGSIFFENILIWISNFGKKYLFYHLDLDKIIESEYIILNFNFFNINIFNKKYSILVLTLESWEYKIFSNLDNADFEVFFEKNILIIKNKILGSVIFEKKIEGNIVLDSLQNFSNENYNYTSILDIYFFNNIFIKSDNLINFDENIENFNFENKFFDNKFYPKNKLEISEKWIVKKSKTFYSSLLNSLSFQGKKDTNYYDKLELLKKFLLFKNKYNFTLDSINYKNLNKYFEEFNFFSPKSVSIKDKININKLNLEKIDENLVNISKQIQDFTMNYYNLEQNYNKIKKINSEYENSKILEQSKRLEIFKKDLEKVKEEYLKYFREFLDKIN